MNITAQHLQELLDTIVIFRKGMQFYPGLRPVATSFLAPFIAIEKSISQIGIKIPIPMIPNLPMLRKNKTVSDLNINELIARSQEIVNELQLLRAILKTVICCQQKTENFPTLCAVTKSFEKPRIKIISRLTELDKETKEMKSRCQLISSSLVINKLSIQ